MRTLILILLLSASAFSQTPTRVPSQDCAELPSQQPFRQLPVWNWSDAALAGAMLADEGSTAHALNRCPTCRELGVVNPGLRIGLKAGVFGFFKAWEYKKPEDRGKIRWIKLAFSGLFVGVAIHNMGSKK